MKIGILTQPLGSNYGGILQNYALQRWLAKMGHEPLTLSHRGHPHDLKTEVRDALVFLAKYALFHPTRKETSFPTDDVNLYLRRFTWRKLKIKEIILSVRTVKRLGLDGFVVGSDQVWRPLYNGKALEWMYCSFLPEDSKVPVVAYAASFGVGEWEYTPEQTEMARRNIRRFKAVSVREASGVRLCREHLGVNAEHVLDPTLLLNPTDYMALVPKRTLAKVPEGCVGVYILDLTDRKRQIVETVCHTLGKRPVYFGCRPEGKTKFPSVENWLANFERSSFIITDSFHGTAFSINFRRPFISIANPTRGANRFTSLLDSVGLQERLISEDGTMSALGALARRSIDWGAVNNRLNQLRKHSMEFLENALS